MLVSDFFTLCRFSTIKQFSLDDATLFAFLNLGLTELHKKFDLIMREQIIEVNSARKEYKLLADVLQVTGAYTEARFLESTTEVAGNSSGSTEVVPMPLNDDNNPFSVYTPTKGVLVVSYPKDDQIISVLYKASPYVYTPADLDKELDIEAQYIAPLVLYMGYAANLGLEATPGQILVLLNLFNQSCTDVENYGLSPSNTPVNDKLNMRGFV